MKTIVVAGPLANKPYSGGAAWSRLSLVRGLLRLGFDAYLLEELDASASRASNGRPAPFTESANLAYFRQAVAQLGLGERATLVCGDGELTEGLALDDLHLLAESADLLVNISGHLQLDSLLKRFRRKAYLDVDPGFTQFWHAAGNPGSRLAGHDVYFTVGEGIGTAECPIPTCGLDWRPTRPIVVLEDWPVAKGDGEGFTTVSSWRGPYGQVEANGHRYGLKVHEFRRFIELPTLTGQPFELALDIHPEETGDVALLRRHGWRLVQPRDVAPDPESFRRYVQASRAEFCVAQGVYVETRSGWFSDRTVRYLASGKPALVQDSGFSRRYPTGEGLIPFTTVEEAVAGAEAIARDYEKHSEAARTIAEHYFDADVVLARMVEEAGVAV